MKIAFLRLLISKIGDRKGVAIIALDRVSQLHKNAMVVTKKGPPKRAFSLIVLKRVSLRQPLQRLQPQILLLLLPLDQLIWLAPRQ